MELWRLKYFVALAEELHFGHAAKRLHITQPGLSQQIKAIERDLEVVLFDRQHGVALTNAGEVLYKDAKSLLERAELLVLDVKAAAAGQSGSLRLAHSRSIEPGGTYAIVEDFRRSCGNVAISTETAWTGKNIEMIVAGEIDAAFVQLPAHDPGVEVLPLGTQELVAAVPSSHPIASSERISINELRSLPMVLFPRRQGPGYYDSIIRQIWANKPPWLGAVESDAEHMLAAVADGKGFAVVERIRGFRLSPKGVTILCFEDPVPISNFGLAWSKQSPTPVTRRFVQHCRDYVWNSAKPGNGEQPLAYLSTLTGLSARKATMSATASA